MLCSDPMSGSYFIVQKSKFLLIDATAVPLGEGHGKVIQYISPDPYILSAKYQRFSSNGFDVRGKSFCGGGGGRGRKELKTKSHPRPGWLNDVMNMYSYNCSHNLMIHMHRKFNDDIFARCLVIMKNVIISFIKEYRGPTLRPPYDVIDDVIIMKILFLT